VPAIPLAIFRVAHDSNQTILTVADWHGDGLLTHWVKGRSLYCPGSDSCRTHAVEATWRAYVHVLLWQRDPPLWRPVVLEVTEHLELELRSHYQPGQVWWLARSAKHGKKNSPCRAIQIETRDRAALPPEVDVTPILVRLFHTEGVRQSVKNPMPSKIFVDVEELPPPLAPKKQAASTPEERADIARGKQLFRDQIGRGVK
jgi:hypothetical protein